MTRRRQRDGRSDWGTFSEAKRATVAGVQSMLATGVCSTCNIAVASVEPGGCGAATCPLREPTARARPVQHEAREMEALATMVYRQWWNPGYMRWEAKTSNWREGDQRLMEGGKKGWPDCGLFIPSGYTTRGEHFLCRAVVEVKAESHRPKRAVEPFWWLHLFEDGHASRYGVSREQSQWLRVLSGCGISTFVAYGAAEAFAWLDEQAGPRPDVLPEGW